MGIMAPGLRCPSGLRDSLYGQRACVERCFYPREAWSKMKRRGLSILCAFILALVPATRCSAQEAEERKGRTDIVVIVDESRSLHYTDPANLRFDALEILPAMVQGEMFRASLIGFSGAPRFYTDSAGLIGKMVPVEQVSEKIPLLRRARLGGLTDLKRALEAAYTSLQARESNYPAYVILFTDGKPEVDIFPGEDITRKMARYSREMDQLVERYAEADYRICPIAFSDQVDVALLQKMARKTGGEVCGATSPADIAPALSELLRVDQIAEEVGPDDFRLAAGDYEAQLAVTGNTLQVRVLVFKKAAGTSHPGIQFFDPQGEKVSPDEQLANQIVAVASVRKPTYTGKWEGVWRIRVHGPGIERGDIRVSRLLGLRLDVVSPSPKAERRYTGRIPLEVRIQKIDRRASTAGIDVIAQIDLPNGQEKRQVLDAIDGETWLGAYWGREGGDYAIQFGLGGPESTCQAPRKIGVELDPPSISLQKLGEPQPGFIKSGETATQAFRLAVDDLTGVNRLVYRLDRVTGSPEGLEVTLGDESFPLVPDEEGKAEGEFEMRLRAESPLPPGSWEFSASLAPSPIEFPHPFGPHVAEDAARALTVELPVGAIEGKPVISLCAPASSTMCEGQKLIVKAESDRTPHLPETVTVAVGHEPDAARQPYAEEQLILGRLGKQYMSEVRGAPAGEWRFALVLSAQFDMGGEAIGISVRKPSFNVVAQDCQISGAGPENAARVTISLGARNLYRRGDVKIVLAPPEGLDVVDPPQRISLNPRGGNVAENITIGLVAKDKLPPSDEGWVVQGELRDASTNEVLAEFSFSAIGSSRSRAFILGVCVVVVAAAIVFVVMKRALSARREEQAA